MDDDNVIEVLVRTRVKVCHTVETRPTLEEAQAYVGGLVEMVYLANDNQMLVNEEGFIKSLPFNHEASVLAGKTLVGDAMVLTGGAKWD